MARRGWGWVAGAAAALIAVGALYTSGSAGENRGPVARPNPEAHAPEITEVGGVPHIATLQPAEQLVLDTVPPDDSVDLLWFQGRGASPTASGAVVLDAAGTPIRFDSRLRAERLRFRLGGREIANLAQSGDGTFWIATREGSVLRIADDGTIADSIPQPFDYTHVVSDAGGRIWAVRSPEQFSFPLRLEPAPLIAPVDHETDLDVPARRPQIPIFVHLVNAGRVVFGEDGSIYFAPFIRDEIIRFGPDGDTVWVATRGLPHGVEEPKFELDETGKPILDYAPVNLGLRWGPDGMLYVLSTPGYTTAVSRLDVIDPNSGIVRRTTELPTPLPTIAVDETGRAYLLDEFVLLTGVAPAERVPLTEFDLPRMRGGRMRLADYEGKLLLINFWASWCAPCREEMPALDTLALSFPGEPFAFIALSDDVEPDKARAFIEEFGFEFPVGLGKGKLRNAYHYIGLPFTVLVDAEGRVVQRWSGFAGDGQIAAIRGVIRTELDRMLDNADPGTPNHTGHAGQHQH